MFIYQNDNSYFAQVAHSLEPLAETELLSLGAYETKQEYRGVSFKAEKKTLYNINYNSRLISRVLAPITKFKCHSEKYLYKMATEIPWEIFFPRNFTFLIFSNVANSNIHHSHYAALVLKDAIVDRTKKIMGKRPSVDKDEPDLVFNLFINHNEATISIDTSGEPLHKRGYRVQSYKAPMQETLAAAIADLVEWDGVSKLYDPMCGSGTLLGEAIIKTFKIPSGSLRDNFGFENMPDYKKELFEEVKTESDSKRLKIPHGLIFGSDIASRAIKTARRNLEILHSGGAVSFSVSDFFKFKPEPGSTIVFNPPWGIRLEDIESLKEVYRDMGDHMKHNFKGSTAYIFAGNRELIKHIGLRTSWKKPLTSGKFDGRLIKLELY